jgi:glucose-1-phosphate adenylyltransferase
MLAQHVEHNADLTVGCIPVPLSEASEFGIMSIDDQQRIQQFDEKPEQPTAMATTPDNALASMGIYIFKTQYLIEQLINDADCEQSTHDFGRDIIPSAIHNQHRVYAYPFMNTRNNKPAYWRDVGTVDSYWRANLELIGVTPELNLYDKHWPIWTYQEQAPPAKFIFNDEKRRGMAVDSMIAGGCIISGATIQHSLLFNSVVVNAYSNIEDAVILPDVVVGEKCRIKKAVIDKGAIIPNGMVIGEDSIEDARRFYVSPNGIVLVTPDMLGQSLHHGR